MWRRRLTKATSRNNLEKVSQLAGEIKENRKELKRAIGKTKREAWEEVLEELNRGPWGRPYKRIMSNIKAENTNICEKLLEEVTEGILKKLFPKDRGVNVYRGVETREKYRYQK